MPLDIIYKGTDKEKELMQEWITPYWKTAPGNTHEHFLDLIILGKEHYDEINAGKMNLKKVQIIAEPLLINESKGIFSGIEGLFYKVDYEKCDMKSHPFVVSLKPVEGSLNFYGYNLKKVYTWKADREGVNFSLKSGIQYLQARLFFLP
jgi:hypothetical protein